MTFTQSALALIIAILGYLLVLEYRSFRRSSRPDPRLFLENVRLSHIYHCRSCDRVIFFGVPHGTCVCGSQAVFPIIHSLAHALAQRQWLEHTVKAGNGSRGRAVPPAPTAVASAPRP